MTKKRVAFIWGEGVSDDQLNIYKKTFDVVLCGESLNCFENDFSKCLSSVILEYDYPMLFVADATANVSISADTISRMIETMQISSHHSFVFLGDLCKYSRFELCDKTSGDCCLINTQMPFLIKDPKSYTGSLKSVLAEWSYEVSNYGYQSVKISSDEKNIHDRENLKTVLLYLKGLGYCHGGANLHILGVLDGIAKNLPKSWKLYVCIQDDLVSYYNLDVIYNNCLFGNESSLKDIYDIAFIPYHWIDENSLIWLNDHAYHWMMWPLDMITRRSRWLKSDLSIATFLKCAKYCTSLFFSCRETLDDFNALFYNSDLLKHSNKKIVYIPAERKKNIENKDLPFESYIFVTGNNRFKYKMIPQIIETAKNSKVNFIILGSKEDGYIAPNIYGYSGGNLSDGVIGALYHNCDAVVFPTVYEGFGIPVLEAINYGKDIILVDMPINHELASLVPDMGKYFHFIQNFSQLDEVIQEIVINKAKSGSVLLDAYKRSWNDVGKDLIAEIERVLSYNVPPVLLEERKAEFCYFKKSGDDLHTLRSIISMDFSSVKPLNTIVIYGCGYNGKVLYHMLKGKCAIKCFIDVKPKSETYDGIPVVKLENYKSYNDDAIVVITVNGNQEKIKDGLQFANPSLTNVVTLSEFLQLK